MELPAPSEQERPANEGATTNQQAAVATAEAAVATQADATVGRPVGPGATGGQGMGLLTGPARALKPPNEAQRTGPTEAERMRRDGS